MTKQEIEEKMYEIDGLIELAKFDDDWEKVAGLMETQTDFARMLGEIDADSYCP
jgi:uncharacterized protein YozE (UPF0346 family)